MKEELQKRIDSYTTLIAQVTQKLYELKGSTKPLEKLDEVNQYAQEILVYKAVVAELKNLLELLDDKPDLRKDSGDAVYDDK